MHITLKTTNEDKDIKVRLKTYANDKDIESFMAYIQELDKFGVLEKIMEQYGNRV